MRLLWLLTITAGFSLFITATTELVVPRSMPTAFAITCLLQHVPGPGVTTECGHGFRCDLCHRLVELTRVARGEVSHKKWNVLRSFSQRRNPDRKQRAPVGVSGVNHGSSARPTSCG